MSALHERTATVALMHMLMHMHEHMHGCYCCSRPRETRPLAVRRDVRRFERQWVSAQPSTAEPCSSSTRGGDGGGDEGRRAAAESRRGEREALLVRHADEGDDDECEGVRHRAAAGMLAAR
jgi:hypothetical protein